MPRLIRPAGFQCRENVHQPRLGPTFLEQGAHPIFLAKGLLADELDDKPRFGGDRFRLSADLLPQGLRPAGIVENPDVVSVEIVGHTLGIAEGMETTLDNHPVVAREYAIKNISIYEVQLIS
jgi:hypothetical protein